MNKKYIDLTNFDIIENLTFFEVDDKIAETISILNKKGYKTVSSCAGHNNNDYQKWTADNEFLEEAKGNNHIYISEQREDTFSYFSENKFTNTYVYFKGHFNFPFLPNGFRYRTAEEEKTYFLSIIPDNELLERSSDFGDVIEREISFYENNNRLEDRLIEKKINEANETLLEWAKALPMLTKR